MYYIRCYRSSADMRIDAYFADYTTDCPTTKGCIVGEYLRMGHVVKVRDQWDGKETAYVFPGSVNNC